MPKVSRLTHSGALIGALIGILAVFTTGCASLEPPLPTADPDLPQQWPDAPPSPQTDTPAPADLGWREFFQDASLQRLISRALANNRDLRVAVLNIEKARAQYRLQRASQLPWVAGSATAEQIGGSQIPDSSNYSIGIGVTAFDVDLSGRVRALSAVAQQQLFTQEAIRRATQIALIAEIATVYLTLALDQEQAQLSRATLQTYQESYRLIEKRFKLGAISALELEQSRTQVEAARVDVARYEGQIAQDRNALTLLVGVPVETALLPTALLDPMRGFPLPPAGLPATVLLRRPDVQAAEHQLRAANANIGAARAAFLPSVTLTGSLGLASTELLELFSNGLVWRFLPQVSVPIFQAGRLEAAVDSAVADRDIALARYEKAIQTGFRQVADGLTAAAALGQQYEAQAALTEAATRAEQLAKLRYQAGRDSYLGLLDAQRTLYAAQQRLLATWLAAQLNRLTLYQVLGGGWQEHD